jgi:hypothetical protein
MPSLYIILEKKIPVADTYVNGSFLSKYNDELDRIARRVGVQPLMEFFSISTEELSAIREEHDADPTRPCQPHQEKWFTADEGLRTVTSLLEELPISWLDRIEAELREFEKILQAAKAYGVRWHLGVDY